MDRNIHKKKIYIYICVGLISLILTAILMTAGRRIDGFADWYADGPYRILVSLLGRIFGLVSFSVSEFLLYGAIFACLLWILRFLFLLIFNKTNFAIHAAAAFCLVGLLLVSYTLGCGINYHRTSFAAYCGFTGETYSLEELSHACRILTEELNDSAEHVRRNKNGVMVHDDTLQEEAAVTMTKLGADYSKLGGFYPRPKKVALPWILSVQQITGIYSPFTFEANYNGDIPDYSIPFTACHELAHLKGYMKEEEANFIAWLACRHSMNNDFRYSGSLRGWISCMNLLYRTDQDAWQEIRKELNPLVEADLKANREYWARYEGPIAEVAEKRNDNYLKANGQSEGVRSYGRMADLIVAYYMES